MAQKAVTLKLSLAAAEISTCIGSIPRTGTPVVVVDAGAVVVVDDGAVVVVDAGAVVVVDDGAVVVELVVVEVPPEEVDVVDDAAV